MALHSQIRAANSFARSARADRPLCDGTQRDADEPQVDCHSARSRLGPSLAGSVLCAADGEEALRLCQQNTAQIAVLDVVMPRLGGSATAGKLLERFPKLRVIFTSGYSRDRDERTAGLSQASHLQKPYSPSKLGRLVRDILDSEAEPATC
jgi:CheY-like chemotaxis protein